MTAVWTHGTWVVRPGEEARFIEAWSVLDWRGGQDAEFDYPKNRP